MQYADEYRDRIGHHDQVLHDARRKARTAPRLAPQPDGLDMVEYAANCRLSPEHLAVVHAEIAREKAIRAWEQEMDDEDRRAMYGLVPSQRSVTNRLQDNVISVDFRSRRRVSATRKTGRG